MNSLKMRGENVSKKHNMISKKYANTIRRMVHIKHILSRGTFIITFALFVFVLYGNKLTLNYFFSNNSHSNSFTNCKKQIRWRIDI